MQHVIWDWNGTLLDDLVIVVESVNASLEPFDAGPITADDYRDHYTRPVYRFYERLLRREISAAEWETIDVTFHDAYRRRLVHAGLTLDARAAIRAVANGPGTQSVLSMWWHDELVPAVARYGLADHMVRVDGNRGHSGETKSEHLAAHIDALGIDAVTCVVIGDSLDDARAARAVGVPCVLYDGGSHHRRELDAAGVAVASSLLEAIELGGAAG